MHIQSKTQHSSQSQPSLSKTVACLFAGLILLASYAGATVTTVNVQTYGALGNGVANDTFAINRAISAIPASGSAVLYFPCGTYIVSSSLTTIAASNITITGPTTSCVTLKAVGSNSVTLLHVAGPGMTASIPLTSNTTSNTFSVASGGLSALGIGVGSYVLVSDKALASNGPGSPLISDQQTVKVTAISGNTATIENTFSTQFTVAAGSVVQKIVSPVVGDMISYLALDATSNTGSNTLGINLSYAAQSVIKYVSMKNFMGNGTSGGYLVDTGYNNSLHDSNCTQCGNGGTIGNNSVMLRRQTGAAVNNIIILNNSNQSVFSFALHESHFSTVQNVSIDAGGANGRPFKLLRASHNSFTNVTANNGGGGHNGFTISDISTYNTFTNCVALSNSGKGIVTFGNHNQHNTFTNCTAKYNTQSQFGQIPAWDGTYTDDYTVVNGGTFCCQRSSPSALVALQSSHTSLTGAVISDDKHVAQNGLTTLGSVTVQNNQFSNLPPGHDIYVFGGLSSSAFSGNTIPDGTSPAGVH